MMTKSQQVRRARTIGVKRMKRRHYARRKKLEQQQGRRIMRKTIMRMLRDNMAKQGNKTKGEKRGVLDSVKRMFRKPSL